VKVEIRCHAPHGAKVRGVRRPHRKLLLTLDIPDVSEPSALVAAPWIVTPAKGIKWQSMNANASRPTVHMECPTHGPAKIDLAKESPGLRAAYQTDEDARAGKSIVWPVLYLGPEGSAMYAVPRAQHGV
jgi:hypothetical protein